MGRPANNVTRAILLAAILSLPACAAPAWLAAVGGYVVSSEKIDAAVLSALTAWVDRREALPVAPVLVPAE